MKFHEASALIDLLSHCGIELTMAQWKKLTPAQRTQAQHYAACCYLKSTGSETIIVPPKPEFLKGGD